MLRMTTPIVIELPLRLEPITADSFAGPMTAAAAVERDARMPDRVMNYVECDLAVELTLPQWRRSRAAASPRRRLGLGTRFTPARRTTPLAG
jgi:hypothetical protein